MKQSSLPFIRAPIVAILIFEAAALVVRAFTQVRLVEGGQSVALAKDISYLVVPPILFVLMYPILRRYWPFLHACLRRQDLTFRIIILAVLLGITLRLSYWGGLISLVSFGVLQNSDPNAVVGPVISFGCPDPGVVALSFLVVSLLIPVIEEVINRGLIFHSLLHHGKIFASVLSSILFAVAHDPQAILLAFFAGLFFCVQVLNYRTLWATIITHATYNGMTILDWECVQTIWNPVEVTPPMIGTGLIASALTLVGIVLCIILVMQKGHRNAETHDAQND